MAKGKAATAANSGGDQSGTDQKAAKAKNQSESGVGTEVFEEWECKIIPKTEDGKTTFGFEKMKLRRPAVKITENEANVLNEGVLNGKNTLVMMYFKPE